MSHLTHVHEEEQHPNLFQVIATQKVSLDSRTIVATHEGIHLNAFQPRSDMIQDLVGDKVAPFAALRKGEGGLPAHGGGRDSRRFKRFLG